MTTIELKSNLHSLIENNKVGLLWNKLSSEQQNDLEQLARKNDSELNLISNEDFMKNIRN